MNNTYKMIDELEKEMDALRQKRPELFSSKIRVLTIKDQKLRIDEVIEAFQNLSKVFSSLGHSQADTLGSMEAFNKAMAREQARREQASRLWPARKLWRAVGRLVESWRKK